MPPKKRTDQSKHTPPISPTTSTSHDIHHRPRHTGPSIGTRSSASAASSKPPSAHAHPESTAESPPSRDAPRKKKSLAVDSPPGARTPLTKFLYVLLVLMLLLFGWYIYGVVTLFERLREDVSWWDIIVGDSRGMPGWGTPEGWDQSARDGGELEGSLNALADALGISPVQVASAVKPVVPQASLTSIVSKSEVTGGSEAVRVLLEDTKRSDKDRADATPIVQAFAERLGGDAADENFVEGSVV